MRYRKKAALYLLVLMIFSAAVSCAGTTGPKVSEKEFKLEKERLAKEAEEFKKEQEGRVRSVGRKLLKNIQGPPDITFEMVDDQSVNAGATFNKVMVTYGMMRFIKSDDELAVVLGHELAHITRGHLKKNIAKSLLLDLPFTVLGVLAESQVGGTGQAVSLLGSAFSQKFNRDYEREADVYGIKYAYESGYDIEAGVNIWERFAVEVPKSMTRSLLNSHPASPERLIRIRKIVEALKAGKGIEGLEEEPK
jgi:predicted Zn-dependent protease